MNEILLKIITLLHIILIICVVGVPFLNSNYLLLLHFVAIPFILIHWVTNNNTCILTIMEKRIRKQLYGDEQKDQCFTCRLIEPVYDVNKNYQTFSKFIYIITIGLWLISATKLYLKYKDGSIRSIRDLCKL